MARFNEILAGRFNRALQKLTSMKGGPPAAQLATEISSNIQFNQMGVDFRYLEGWNRFSNSPPAIAAAAGNNCEFRLVNDINTNVVGVIEKLWVFTSLADEIDLCLFNLANITSGHVPTLTANPSVPLDARAPGGSLGGSVLQGGTSTVSNTDPHVIGRFQLPANGTLDIILDEDHQLAILPQSFMQVQTSVVTNTIRVVCWWRERFLEDSERS